MNYYEKHLGDYAKQTTHLSMLQHGAYNLLLDRYYVKEAPIPVDQVYGVAKATTKQERAAVDSVLREFFVLKDGAWHKNRCDEEIAKKNRKAEAARTNGVNGGRPKRNPDTNPVTTETKPTGLSVGSQNVTHEKALQSPVTSNQSPDPGNRSPQSSPAVARAKFPEWGGVEPPEFVKIKAAYPDSPYPNNWAMALVQCEQRTMEGLDWPSILQATERFAAFAKATNHRVGRAENFFANRRNLDHTWALPKTRGEQQQDANVEASLAWLRESEARDATG